MPNMKRIHILQNEIKDLKTEIYEVSAYLQKLRECLTDKEKELNFLQNKEHCKCKSSNSMCSHKLTKNWKNDVSKTPSPRCLSVFPLV